MGQLCMPEKAEAMSELVEIPLDLVRPGDNDRTAFDQVALQELAESIRDHGLAQPITVRPVEGGYEIVAGERRTRACRLLGWTVIPAIVRAMDDEQAAAIMLAENVKRVDLNPMDEGRAYQKRMDSIGWSVVMCADKANVSEDKLRARVKLLALAPEIQVLVASGQMTTGYAEALADLDLNRQRIAMRYFSEARQPTLSEFRQRQHLPHPRRRAVPHRGQDAGGGHRHRPQSPRWGSHAEPR